MQQLADSEEIERKRKLTFYTAFIFPLMGDLKIRQSWREREKQTDRQTDSEREKCCGGGNREREKCSVERTNLQLRFTKKCTQKDYLMCFIQVRNLY